MTKKTTIGNKDAGTASGTRGRERCPDCGRPTRHIGRGADGNPLYRCLTEPLATCNVQTYQRDEGGKAYNVRRADDVTVDRTAEGGTGAERRTVRRDVMRALQCRAWPKARVLPLHEGGEQGVEGSATHQHPLLDGSGAHPCNGDLVWGRVFKAYWTNPEDDMDEGTLEGYFLTDCAERVVAHIIEPKSRRVDAIERLDDGETLYATTSGGTWNLNVVPEGTGVLVPWRPPKDLAHRLLKPDATDADVQEVRERLGEHEGETTMTKPTTKTNHDEGVDGQGSGRGGSPVYRCPASREHDERAGDITQRGPGTCPECGRDLEAV